MILLLLALGGCGGDKAAPVETGGSTPHDTTNETGQQTSETAETAESAETAETAHGESGETGGKESADTSPAETAEPAHVEEESVDDMDDPAGWLFSEDEVHEIDITLPADSMAAFGADPYSYVEADVEIDGMAVSDVGIRLKGKIGSFRPLSSKAAFKIDFNYYNPDQSFYGLKKINLNNMVADCSMLKEHMAYKVFRDMGVPAERTGWAWVTVNGDPFGLYNVLEQPNKELLERWYDDPTGNEYDGKYLWYGGYSYTLLDLQPSLATLYPLEEGVDVTNTDVSYVAGQIYTYGGTADFYTQVGTVVDWDKVLTFFVVEQWVGQNDGYVLNTNNNFIYFKADDGLLTFLPWDMDYSHLSDSDWGMNWASPRGVLAAYCRLDATCLAAWKAKAQEVVESIDTDVYDDWLVEQAALIHDYAADDPRKECSMDYVVYYQDYVKNYVAYRPTYMKSFWGF